MTTANGNRDSNMYRVLGFPGIKTIEANIQKVTPIENNRYKISGNLKIKAKELPFTAEGIFSKEGDMYILQGSFSVMLSDYGVERPVLIVSIDNTVRIDFRIQLK
jgi:polyisoprenoid-binding protein YceI